MPREIDGKRYYETTEVCEKVGISRPTLFRWLRRGILSKLHRDRRGWRLFTDEDLSKIQTEAKKIEVDHISVGRREK
jgi:DNA-binding transcriptional MerR regulator